MTLSLPEKKVSKVQKQCQELLQKIQVSILELTKLIGLLSPTILAVLPAQINFRYLQQQQIQAGVILQKSDSEQKLQGRTALVDKKFENLQWSLLDLVSQSSADTGRCIQKGMRCSMSRDIIRGRQWSKEKQLLQINVLELKVVKLALLTINKEKSLKAVHFEIDNTTALLCLVKMGGGGIGNQMLLKLSKEI